MSRTILALVLALFATHTLATDNHTIMYEATAVAGQTAAGTSKLVKVKDDGTVVSADGLFETLSGAAGTCVNIDTKAGANATGTLTGGVRYRVVNTSGVYTFCKIGGAATVEVDVPYPPDMIDYATVGDSGEGSLTMNCIQRSVTPVGKMQFCPLTAKTVP